MRALVMTLSSYGALEIVCVLLLLFIIIIKFEKFPNNLTTVKVIIQGHRKSDKEDTHVRADTVDTFSG